jgi:ankyrin repeat protein
MNARGLRSRTALHYAAMVGLEALAQGLLVAGADINATDETGWTPLHWAAWKNKPEVAKVLLANGTTPSQKGGSLAASPSRSACSRRSASGSRSETSSSGAPGWQPNKEAHILKKYFLRS